MAARTSLEEETPDAALLRFLSFIFLNTCGLSCESKYLLEAMKSLW